MALEMACDYTDEDFSFNDELDKTKMIFSAIIQKFRKTNFKVREELDLGTVIESLETTLENEKKLFYENHKKFDELRKLRKTLIDKNKMSEILYKNLIKECESLQSEISTLTPKQKIKKTAYNQAISLYKKNFGFQVDIIESTKENIIANIIFKIDKDKTPIKVEIDKVKREIIGLQAPGLLNEEPLNKYNPEILYFLREKLLTSNSILDHH